MKWIKTILYFLRIRSSTVDFPRIIDIHFFFISTIYFKPNLLHLLLHNDWQPQGQLHHANRQSLAGVCLNRLHWMSVWQLEEKDIFLLQKKPVCEISTFGNKGFRDNRQFCYMHFWDVRELKRGLKNLISSWKQRKMITKMVGF